jgi:hypothetical protein
VDALSEKLKIVQSDVVRLDFDSFSEPEKQLFRKVWEIQKKHGFDLSADVSEAEREFVLKAGEVVSWRVLQLFMFVMKELLQGDEVEEWYFKLYFFNFFEDLTECLQRVRKWSEKDREEFLRDMKGHGIMDKVFRIPKSSSREDSEKRKEKRESRSDD